MKTIVIISTLFVIGSVVGWLIELLWRRFVSRKKWMNPGFLVGPYLPIYGMGVIALYGISNLHFSINIALAIIIKILLIGLVMTLIEFVIGIISTKVFKVKLWDYSKNKGNIMGVICPLYSFFWLLIGSAYYFLINPFLVEGISWISHNLIYTYFIGLVIGMTLVDFAYSIHLASKLKQFKEYEGKRFDEFKKEFKSKLNKIIKQQK